MSSGMVYAFFEPTLLDFVTQSLQQECRVQIPPNITDNWSPKFEEFRDKLVVYLTTVHAQSFWELLLKDNGFGKEESPAARDFLFSFMRSLVAEYAKVFWTDCLAGLGTSCIRKDIEEIYADVERESIQVLDTLRLERKTLPYRDWGGFREFSGFSLQELLDDLMAIK